MTQRELEQYEQDVEELTRQGEYWVCADWHDPQYITIVESPIRPDSALHEESFSTHIEADDYASY